ncbi:SIR2 family protein [Sulfurovum mangrovi]|uniref:SIR2 family protein n=1 Tax=Sulfurovum mangrovi TaxID=2893889 RepID=UPI001E456B0A|nr:SIR2 family protein [Sulfurovum mangrovi]UFH58391.1 SIR2 family protein [Sulfurovum mangrovi]
MEHILKENNKAIVHLRQQFKNKNLGLVFGAGASMNLGFPSWENLIKDIAEHSMVDGISLYESVKNSVPQSSITDILFQHFKTKRIKELEGEDEYFIKKRLLSDWRGIIYSSLYREALKDRKGKLLSHPYLNDFIPLIQNSEITINYNFDDTLEFILSEHHQDDIQKPYQVLWESHSHYKTGSPVIYHPNGFLPEDENSQQSEELIFSDESFSDQLLESMSGKSNMILNQFTKKTCILVGLSLEDATLKHLLRQSAVLSPGNYHYYIRYTNTELSRDEKEAIFNSNFTTYNLVTLFFNDEEISTFTRLITQEAEEFQIYARELDIPIKFVNYFVGSVAVGKSSILSHFGNFHILEEWIDKRPAELVKPFNDLTPEEEEQVEKWINGQFYKKNKWLDEQREGFFLIDRSPLDPISFTNNNHEEKKRAESMLQGIANGEGLIVVPGHIIFLESDEKEQKGRLLTKRKVSWTEEFLIDLNMKTKKLYGDNYSTYIINSRSTLHDTIKNTAKVLFCDGYSEINLHTNLEVLAKQGITL